MILRAIAAFGYLAAFTVLGLLLQEMAGDRLRAQARPDTSDTGDYGPI